MALMATAVLSDECKECKAVWECQACSDNTYNVKTISDLGTVMT